MNELLKQSYKMQLLMDPKKLSETFENLILNCEKIFFATAWATDKHSVFNTLIEQAHKIEMAIVGLHFYQTSPKFIESFMDNEKVFFKKTVSGVFHPKVFIFKFKNSYKIILGSANFTSGAFHSNDEISIMLEMDENEDNFIELMQKLSEYSENNEKITSEYLELYKEKYKVQKMLNSSLKDSKHKKQVKALKSCLPPESSLNMSWKEFKQEVENDLYDGFNQRLELLDQVKMLLKIDKFENLNKDERKLIAGMKNNLPYNSGWFGSLEGAGFMKNVINMHASQITKALEVIPSDGNILKKHFNQYIKLFNIACSGQEKSPQIATYTRFLAVIRPDFFVPINKKNEIRIRKSLSLKSKINIDNYWDILQEIHKKDWYKIEISKDSSDHDLWSKRAAMIDAIYYNHED